MTSADRPRTVLVVPCYNEEDRLDLEAFRAFVRKHDVRFLFVNDGSTDGTQAVLESLAASDGEAFEVMALERNSGKAEAVRLGTVAALEAGADNVGFWDADLSTPLDEIPGMLDVLSTRPEIAMVFGSRVNLLGRHVRRKLARHYIGRVFATAASRVLRLPIYDTQCGAKIFRAGDELAGIFREPFVSGWIFDVEILARFLVARRGSDLPALASIIYEQPLMRWEDVEGSKLRPRHVFVVVGDFLRIWRRYLRRGRAF